MKNKLTPDEFFKLFGKLFAGISDQYTVIVKSRAGMSYIDLTHALRLPTHAMASDCEQAARAVFEPEKKTPDPESHEAYDVILLALTYLEDGAPRTAEDRLRKFIDEHETLEIEKETSPNA